MESPTSSPIPSGDLQPIAHSTPINRHVDKASQTILEMSDIACQATNTAREIRESSFYIGKVMADDVKDPSCKPLKHPSQPRSCGDFCCDSSTGSIFIGVFFCVILILTAFWFDYSNFLKNSTSFSGN